MQRPDTLQIIHSYGFFSCCSVRLYRIVEYYTVYGVLPVRVDSSKQFDWYKPKANSADITSTYFLTDTKGLSPNHIRGVQFHVDDQYIDYTRLPYDTLGPLISTYFSLTPEILTIVDRLQKKYAIDYENTCVLFYRGNDKLTETPLSDYSETLEKARELQTAYPTLRFLVQSDETEYIEQMLSNIANSFYCKDEIRHMTKRIATVDHVFRDMNYEFSKYFLAITYMMSKCKYVISGSNGNCSLWIALFRGSARGIFQYPRPLNNILNTTR